MELIVVVEWWTNGMGGNCRSGRRSSSMNGSRSWKEERRGVRERGKLVVEIEGEGLMWIVTVETLLPLRPPRETQPNIERVE